MPTKDDINDWDWDPASLTVLPIPRPKSETAFLMMQAKPQETTYERKQRMLFQARNTCMACTMCELGRQTVSRDGSVERDPHVFSNQNPTRFMITGQNPGWNEVIQGTPFVGDAGSNFNTELKHNNLDRSFFYINNVVRCHTTGNTKPEHLHIQRCSPFLEIEINLIRPILVITLGGVAFNAFCPNDVYSEHLGTITRSKQFDVPVFAIYHPSPRNLEDEERKRAFKKQMRTMCGLVKRLMETNEWK